MVDVILVIIVLLSAVWGYMRGALLGVLTLAALVAAFAAGVAFGPAVSMFLSDTLGFSTGAAYVLGRLGAGVGAYLPLVLFASWVDTRFGRASDGVLYGWNRQLGWLCGTVSGLVAATALALAVDVGVKVFPEASGPVMESARGSWVRQHVSNMNPADRFLVTDTLRILRAARVDPAVLDDLSADPQIRKVMDHPSVRAMLKDEDLMEALQRRQVDSVVANERLREALADKELRALLTSPETRAALDEALRRSEEARQQQAAAEQAEAAAGQQGEGTVQAAGK